MDLDKFIAATLVGIANGIDIADKQLKDSSCIVNPRDISFNYSNKIDMVFIPSQNQNTPRVIEKIEFDVAVTVSEGSETKGGIGIVVGAIGLGSQGKSDLSNSATSRIKFSIPMVFPNGTYNSP